MFKSSLAGGRRARIGIGAGLILALCSGCGGPALGPGSADAALPQGPAEAPAEQLRLVNRLTWGANGPAFRQISSQGSQRYLEAQLRAQPAVPLPEGATAQIAAMEISRKSIPQLIQETEAQRKAADAMATEEEKKAAHQAFQQHLNQLAREAATRSLLRDLYSPQQVQEQMTWFWLNHFSVHQGKGNLRLMVGDYEDQIRAHALGRFRDLLAATLHHPAMLRYLDNEHNALGHINENYARELMELHTLGVDGGYSQKDVQELARILTGVGINFGDQQPTVRKEIVERYGPNQYQRQGGFEFNPNRHDYGDKVFLGAPLRGRGLPEVDEVLDRLARHPATARFIARKLARFWVGDNPPEALINDLVKRYQESDGRIDAVLATLFRSGAFRASLGKQFKDPMHYVVSAVRLAYEDKVILNSGPMLSWLNRMGESLYGHQTPDGYPLTTDFWSSSGQMSTRFEIAKALGSGHAGLFRSEGPEPREKPAFPQLANALYYQVGYSLISPATRSALEQATSPQEWNGFLLSSPEFMQR